MWQQWRIRLFRYYGVRISGKIMPLDSETAHSTSLFYQVQFLSIYVAAFTELDLRNEVGYF
jgi:hypothetical protein